MGSSDFPVKLKDEPDKKNYCSLHCNWTIAVLEWFVMNYHNRSSSKAKKNFFILYFFKKGTFILEGGAIAPNASPQLHHWIKVKEKNRKDLSFIFFGP